MILGFGVVMIGIIGVVGASLAAPFAVVVGGIHKLRGGRLGGLPSGMLTWVVLTTGLIVTMCLGLTGNAARGVGAFGIDFEVLMGVVPYAWLLAAGLWLGFSVAARRRGGADESNDPPE